SANQAGAFQVGTSDVPNQSCVPLNGGSPLADRKFVVVSFPTDGIHIGRSPVGQADSYFTRGSGRGSTWSARPKTERYSNRFQFLRGQYLTIAIASDVQLCLNAINI